MKTLVCNALYESCEKDISEESKSIAIVQKIDKFKNTEIDKEEISKAAIKKKRLDENSVKDFVNETEPVQTCFSNTIELTKETVRNGKIVDPEIAKSGERKNQRCQSVSNCYIKKS